VQAMWHYRRGHTRNDGTFVAPHLGRSPRRAAAVPRRRLVVFLEWYAALRLLLIVVRLSGRAASGLTGLAVLLAGRKRAALGEEWRAHLAGESGHDPASWQKARQAAGFVISAIRYRCSDIAEAARAVADAILRSRPLSNLVVIAPTAAAAYLVLRHEGTLGMVKSAESIGTIGGTLYALIRTGRWWRNVKPPAPKARQAKE